MSILIKGMEMPESCHKCEFIDILPTCPCRKMEDGDFWYNVSLAVDVHKDCPLVPVPPHGRLIDADANLAVMMRVLDAPYTGHGTIDTAMLKACIKMFEEAPTIIEEER